MNDRALEDGSAAYVALPAREPPRAAVIFAHGFAEGALRHAPTFARFADAGIAAFACDFPGHGRSPGPRGFVRRFADLLASEALLRTRVRERLPGVPVFLMGYSLGAIVALRSAQGDGQDVAGVIAIAAGLGIATRVPAFLRTIAIAVAEVAPHLPVARLRLRDLRPEDEGHRRASLLDVLLPRDPLIPARTATEAIRASRAAFGDAATWRIPTLFVHGDRDSIAPLAAAQRFIARAAGPDVTLDLIAGGHHDLLTGRDGDGVRRDVLAWIRSRSG